jgi:hypothetical protein
MEAGMNIDDQIVQAHDQTDTYSCIPMAIELVLKLLGRVPLDYYELQTDWKSKADGNFADFDGEIIKDVKFIACYSTRIYPRGVTFPLTDLFDKIDSELKQGRFVIIALPIDGGVYHNWVIYNKLSNGEYEGVTRGNKDENIRDIRTRVNDMKGTDILTYVEINKTSS